MDSYLNNTNKISNQESKNVAGTKIVPAYMNKKEENNSKKPLKSNKKSSKKINSKLIILIIFILILLIVLGIFLYIIMQNKKYSKYLPYEETMHTYAFDIMYDNETAATKEKVTKSEALKLAIASTLNITSIPGFIDDGTFSNNVWVKYAIIYGVIEKDEINESNASDIATYMDIIKYLERSKVNLLGDDLKTSVELEFTDKEDYTVEEQTYLQDLIESGVIENTKSKFKGNRKIFKGQVNELITKYAEKNNTITLYGDKININPDKEPSNADTYTYILSNVDKKIYEIKLQEGEFTDWVLSPKETYIERKEDYQDIKEMVEEYFNSVLNIDYNNISVDEFGKNINLYTISDYDEEVIEEYVNYVKNNKIKISGTAKVQMPIVYYDGVDYRVRTKLKFEIIESLVYSNILFNDLTNEEDIKYQIGENEFIIDAKLGIYLASDGIRINRTVINDLIVK